jgi:protein-tyrosine phosphatase
MRAFWWFEENAIAGMARPGFNCTRWFDFPFDQAVLVGWLGQHSSGTTSLSDFQKHVREYGSKILKFYHLSGSDADQALSVFESREGILEVFRKLSEGSQLLEHYDVTDLNIHFTFSQQRLKWELDFLRDQGISKIVSLTERHHSKEALQEQFSTFHFSINDLDAPSIDQVRQLSEVLRNAKKNKERVAVHCLAGIGRTSTMLIGAHMVLGETLESMRALIARRNPAFVFAGKQLEFLNSLSEGANNYA